MNLSSFVYHVGPLAFDEAHHCMMFEKKKTTGSTWEVAKVLQKATHSVFVCGVPELSKQSSFMHKL